MSSLVIGPGPGICLSSTVWLQLIVSVSVWSSIYCIRRRKGFMAASLQTSRMSLPE